MRLGCKNALNRLIGVWAANEQRIGSSGCKLALVLQTGNRQRTGVWAAYGQRIDVLAANWRLGCKTAIGIKLAFWLQFCSELAFGLQIGSELAFWLQIGVWAANWQSAANLRLGCKYTSCIELAFWLKIGVWAANWRLGCKLAAIFCSQNVILQPERQRTLTHNAKISAKTPLRSQIYASPKRQTWLTAKPKYLKPYR